MAYNSFKRVFVESSLERKCLLMFGVSLFLLIVGAFWYAERVAEKLVLDTVKQTGRNFVDHITLRHHVRTSKMMLTSVRSFYEEFEQSVMTQNYQHEILAVGAEPSLKSDTTVTRLARPEEMEAVNHVFELFVKHVDELATEETADAALATPVIANSIDQSPDQAGAVFSPEEKMAPVSHLEIDGNNNYAYYQPIYWKTNCISCHESNGERFDTDIALRPERRGPYRVFKVTIPDSQTQDAMAKTRAILLATAIVTVFLSVIALYLVVRFIIIRPLYHLRDVSDEISRGNTNLRADIQTNDEFEELAASFNRMLRHLVDAQEELRKVNGNLDGKVDELAQANMQLHEMNRVKSDFLANMSHELRTPLNSIIGFSDVLRRIDSLNGKQKRYLENIGQSGRVLLDMINDILDLAKVESGKMDLRLSQFDIAQVVRAQCDLVRGLSEEKNIDLEIETESDMPPMVQDQGKVQQILTNLLSNAIKFTPEGGRIDVSAKRRDGFLIMQVADTGVGIAEEDRTVIFEKFRQGKVVHGEDNLTREFSGTGLGLSIIKELCKLLGGEISFESELGKGSTFRAAIPWRKSPSQKPDDSLTARLNEATKPSRFELLRSSHVTSTATGSSSQIPPSIGDGI